MFLESVDASYWLLMPVLSCIGLAVAVIAVTSGRSGQRCCKTKSREDDVCWVADDKKCNNDDDPSKAVEADYHDDDAEFLNDIVMPMRPLHECHSIPYLYERSHDKSTKVMTVVHSFNRNRNIVNTLTEQMHRNFPVATSGVLVSNSIEPKGTALAIHGDQSSVPEDQIQPDVSTSSRGTYETFPDKTLECCESNDRTYAKLTSLTELSHAATVGSYTSLKNPETDSYIHVTTTSGLLTLLPNGDHDAYNYSLPVSDSNVYSNTLPDSTVHCDTLQLPGDSIKRPTIAILRSCERRSKVESGHYSTLDPHDCEKAMSGIYDTIQDMKYLTVCTTSPASTKQQHELKERVKAELEATKQKTMTPFKEIELKTSTNEVY